MRALRIGMAVVVLALVAAGGGGVSRADDCTGSSLVKVRAEGAPLWLDVRTVAGRWSARVVPAGRTDVPWSPLAEVPAHAHLIVAGPDPSGRFAVVRAGAEHDDVRRVLVYGPARPGAPELRLVRAYDLADLLTATELTRVTRSISHLQWLHHPADGRTPVRLIEGGAKVAIDVMGGRTVTISLDAAPPAPAPHPAPATAPPAP